MEMNITELDEWQGLTAELVAKWLVVNGWQQTKPNWWDKGEDWFWFDSHVFDQQMFWLYALAAACGHNTPQSLLREINPRMRKGMPSEAAREAHGFKGGMWVGSRGEAGSGGTLVFVSFDDSSSGLPLTVWDFSEFDTWEVGQSEIDDEWLFWPADESGNKTRWPTDAEGNML
jgi:hypothetical protein